MLGDVFIRHGGGLAGKDWTGLDWTAGMYVRMYGWMYVCLCGGVYGLPPVLGGEEREGDGGIEGV